MGQAEKELREDLGLTLPTLTNAGLELGNKIDAALAEAREHRDEDLREMARNRAMRAAACRDESDYETAARFDAQASVLREALAGKPPPDTGWRDRPPTPEEVEAHPDEWVFDDGDEAHVCFLNGQPNVEAISDTKGNRWRPVTRELFPAPWPEPERDVECLCGNNVGAVCPLHSSGTD